MNIKQKLVGISLGAFFALSYCGLALSQFKTSVEGWRNTTWGMAKEQVVELYPNAKESLLDNGNTKLTVSDFAIDDYIYDLSLLINPKGELILVTMNYSSSSMDKAMRANVNLYNLLKQKYGKEDESTKILSFFQKTWILDETVIRLGFIGGQDQNFVNLSYEERKVNDKI